MRVGHSLHDDTRRFESSPNLFCLEILQGMWSRRQRPTTDFACLNKIQAIPGVNRGRMQASGVRIGSCVKLRREEVGS